MLNGGHLTGYQVNHSEAEVSIAAGLKKLIDPESFRKNIAYLSTSRLFSSQWVMEIIPWQPPKPSGKRESKLLGWIILQDMLWSKWKTSTTPVFNLNPSIASFLI